MPAFAATPRPGAGVGSGIGAGVPGLPLADEPLPKKNVYAAGSSAEIDVPLTDEQAAELLLLRDPLCCECANRLGQVRAVTDRHRAEMQVASVYSEVDGGGSSSCGGSGSHTPEQAKEDKQRLERLRRLEEQLERALQNQRRYVLGRCGLGHLADGLVHLEGLGRLAESSAWRAPGAPTVLFATMQTTCSTTGGAGGGLPLAAASGPGGLETLESANDDAVESGEEELALFSPTMASRRLTQMLETGEIQPLRFSGPVDGQAALDDTLQSRGGVTAGVSEVRPEMSRAELEKAVLAQLERMEQQYLNNSWSRSNDSSVPTSDCATSPSPPPPRRQRQRRLGARSDQRRRTGTEGHEPGGRIGHGGAVPELRRRTAGGGKNAVAGSGRVMRAGAAASATFGADAVASAKQAAPIRRRRRGSVAGKLAHPHPRQDQVRWRGAGERAAIGGAHTVAAESGRERVARRHANKVEEVVSQRAIRANMPYNWDRPQQHGLQQQAGTVAAGAAGSGVGAAVGDARAAVPTSHYAAADARGVPRRVNGERGSLVRSSCSTHQFCRAFTLRCVWN